MRDYDYGNVPGLQQMPIMTLRDYFAGQALAGILAGWPANAPWPDSLEVATRSYRYADDMMETRKEQG